MLLQFEKIILKRCPTRFNVSNLAPDTWNKTQESYFNTGIITVWSGGSDKTIFSAPLINWCGRAWHDSIHLAHGYDFSLHGEEKTCEAQIADLYHITTNKELRQYGARLLECEIVGQADYYFKTGRFIDNQKEFTRLWGLL